MPRALILSDVTIDTTDGALRFFEFARKSGSARPKACGVLPFPRLYRSRESKEPREGGSLAEAASTLKAFAKARHYQTAKAVIHEGDAYVFKLKLPTVEPSELAPAIEAALEENVPIPPSEALFEYDVVSVDRVRGETVVAVSAVSEEVVRGYEELLDAGSLAPVAFETESRAIARAAIKQGDEAAHAVLCIKARHTVVFIVEKGKVTFSSSIDVGSADLDLAREKAPAAMEDGTEDAQIFDTLLPVFSTLQDELGKVLVYFKTAARKEGEPAEIADVILLGSSSRIAGFARYISIAAKLPARIGSVWTNVLSVEEEVPELDERSSLDYASVIGAYLK